MLPIGISFFTFQIVSYLIDVGRGDAPRYGFRRFAVVIMLFPHLIAGPDRAPCRTRAATRCRSDGATASPSGCRAASPLFLVGFLTKVLIADKLRPCVDRDLRRCRARRARRLLRRLGLGALGFALQIYLDFAAYSEMAIGLALMLGLTFPINFAMPYRATSLRDFWRRWHMSLSRFLRDYLYIPLGGSRDGFGRFALATLATMGLCGLWHGAGWTFVVWGLVHGAGSDRLPRLADARLALPDALGWAADISVRRRSLRAVPRARSRDRRMRCSKGMAGTVDGLGDAGRP